jgi:hypothetical protein
MLVMYPVIYINIDDIMETLKKIYSSLNSEYRFCDTHGPSIESKLRSIILILCPF